jgi:uncharacterized membrane protein YecN with MAPEG domain
MTPTILPVTFTAVSLLAISLIPMTGWIGLLRGKVNILRGAGENDVLFKRIRIHGNLIENAPIFLMVLATSEYLGLAQSWLWVSVATFISGRVLHFMLYDNKMRGGAMTVTLLPGVAMGIWILRLVWG